MAAMVRVETMGVAEARDLVEVLARHGLTGSLVTAADRCEVEIGYRREDVHRLLREVAEAVETWLRDRGLPPAVVRAGGERVLVGRRLSAAHGAGERPGTSRVDTLTRLA